MRERMMPVALASNCGLSLFQIRSRFQITASAVKSVPSFRTFLVLGSTSR